MRTHRGRHAGKTAAADLGKGAARPQRAIADSPRRNPEDSRAVVTTQYAKGLGNTVPDDRVAAARGPGDRQADVLLFRQRRILFLAEALARPADYLTSLRDGNTHLRHANCAGRLREGYLVHVASDAVSSRAEFNWRIGLDRMRAAGSDSILDRNDDLRVAALVRRAGVSRTTALSEGLKRPSLFRCFSGRGATHPSFCFTRTTVIFEKPSSKVGAFNLPAILRMMSSGTARPRRWWRSMQTSSGTSKNKSLHIVAVILRQLDPAVPVVRSKVGRIHVAHRTPGNQPRLQHRAQVRKDQILEALLLLVIEKKFPQQIARKRMNIVPLEPRTLARSRQADRQNNRAFTGASGGRNCLNGRRGGGDLRGHVGRDRGRVCFGSFRCHNWSCSCPLT